MFRRHCFSLFNFKQAGRGIAPAGQLARIYCTRALKNMLEFVGVTVYGDEAEFVVHGPNKLVDCNSEPIGQLTVAFPLAAGTMLMNTG